MTDHPAHHDLERRNADAPAAPVRSGRLDVQWPAVTPMTAERWDSLAIDDLTDDEAIAFWQAIAG